MGDKSLPYDVLKKVMATCTDADYGKISLAVLQKEKPVDASSFKPGLRTESHVLLAPYYRSYELAWEGDPGVQRAFPQDPARRAHPAAWCSACCSRCCRSRRRAPRRRPFRRASRR